MKRQSLILRLFYVLGLAAISSVSLAAMSGSEESLKTDTIDQAIQNPNRPEADVALDEKRKPSEVLHFFGIEPGMKVFDIFAGGGYYSELLSNIVGPKGAVTLYNNKAWDDFVKKSVETRLAAHRLGNVTQLVAPPESLQSLPSEFDAALFVLGMHDIYYTDESTGWVKIDRLAFMRGMFKLLKPGAVLGVIDHNAVANSDPAVVSKALHRIDPEQVIADLESVGFVLEARSTALANPLDDRTTSVFTPKNRWNTDRSILKFRKPI